MFFYTLAYPTCCTHFFAQLSFLIRTLRLLLQVIKILFVFCFLLFSIWAHLWKCNFDLLKQLNQNKPGFGSNLYRNERLFTEGGLIATNFTIVPLKIHLSTNLLILVSHFLTAKILDQPFGPKLKTPLLPNFSANFLLFCVFLVFH